MRAGGILLVALGILIALVASVPLGLLLVAIGVALIVASKRR